MSILGEVVAGDDVFFFLRHTFLVFFGGVDGAGVGSFGCRVDDFQISPHGVGDEIRDLLVIFYWLSRGIMNLPIFPGRLGWRVMNIPILLTGLSP